MSRRKKLQVLIVDDERPARRRLEHLLNAREDVEIAGQAENGREAIEAIYRLSPDLVLLDVQMPKTSGVDVVREIGPERMPAVIFVTAYDQYALEAFELAALDYLLKPFDTERFEQALERARETIIRQEVDVLRDRLAELLEGRRSAEQAPSEEPKYLQRITVKSRDQVRVIPVEEIDFISASGNYAELHVADGTYLIRERMQDLEERLAPDQFFRVHRSYIVRLDRIDALLINEGGNYAVKLKDGQRLKVSRSRREELEDRLGIDL